LLVLAVAGCSGPATAAVVLDRVFTIPLGAAQAELRGESAPILP
jgi:hypothetical protein